MKITKKSFQAFFTRASFAGLLLGGALAAQAQTAATTDDKDTLSQFSFERIFAAPAASSGKSRFLFSDAWATNPAVAASVPSHDGESAAPAAQDWSASSVFSTDQSSWYDAASSPVSSPVAATAARASFAGSAPAGTVAPLFSGTSPATAPTVLTSGSLNTITSSNYSTAPWTISTGDGSYPDLGGTATFNPEVAPTPGTVAGATVTITLDISPTLGAVVVNNPFFQAIAGTATTSLIMPATGTTFTLNGVVNSPSYTLFNFQEATTGVISGGGTAGLIANGTGGSFLLQGTNTYTGGTHISGGALVAVYNSDANLGATGTGNGIYLSGGGTLVNDFSGYTTTRDISLGAGGGNFLLFYPMTDSGTVSGAGNLNINNAVLTLTGTNTYTGATVITSPFAGLTLSGAGTTNASSAYDLSGTITLDSSTTNNSDRLNNAATITDRGATITLTGNATAATNEAAGPLVLANGVNSFVVTPNTAQPASLSFSSITRQNGSTMFLRGTGLGGTAGNGVAEITTGVAPTLVGGGATSGTNISILPWAVGNASATSTASSSFVTYDSTTGQFRPLATGEYSALASGEADTNNTSVAIATAITAPTTVNSVLVTGTGTLLSGTGGLTITSGALMYSPAATTAGTISANLNFGTAEGIISTTAGAANSTASALTLSGVISGSGGLTINSVIGSDIAITGANTYTGTTTLLGGLTKISGTIASDGVTPGPLGLSTSAVVLNETGNTNLNGIYATAATTFNRPLNVVGGTNGNAAILLIGAGYAFTLNGSVNIAAGAQLAGYDTGTGSATNAFIYNNIISGGGLLTDESSGTFTVLNAANTYSGGTNIYAGTYVVGIDSATNAGGVTTSGAFGTGTIYFSNAGAIRSSGTTAHTVSNPLVMASSTATFSGTGGLTFTGAVNLDGAKTLAISNTAGTTFTGVVDNGAITKTGAGALALNSATGNTYTGGTVLGNNVGVLYGNNTSGSAFGAGAVSIGATSATAYSTLAGSFSTSGAVSIAGRLSPGNGTGLTATTAGIGSIGQISFGSSLTLSSATTSSLYLEIGSTSSFDRITVAGAFTLNGTVFVATTGGYTIQPGDTFTVATYGSLTAGTYTFNTASASLAPGVILTETVGANGLVVTAVPEPGTWAAVLGGLGVLGSVQFARRRRNRGA